MKTTADAVVIGGGVVGSAIAYYLARRGIRPVLVERGAPGAGTSSAAGGAVALLTKTPGTKLEMALRSLSLYDEIVRQFEIDFEFHVNGSIMVAQTEEQLESLTHRAEKLRLSGPTIEILDTSATRDYMPALNENVVGAAISEADASLNPLLLVGAYQHEARKLGAETLLYTEVIAIETQGGRVRDVVTSQGRIATATVVNASGVWAKEIASMVGVELPIVPRKGEIVVTQAAPPVLKGELFSASYLISKETPGVSLADWLAGHVPRGQLQVGIAANQTQRGNILIGSTRQFAGFDTRSTFRGLQALVRQMVELVPHVAEMHLIRAYAGLRPSTPDGLPIIEASPGVSGFFVAAGHEGDGIALSPVTGEMIAGLVAGDEGHLRLAQLDSARFSEN